MEIALFVLGSAVAAGLIIGGLVLAYKQQDVIAKNPHILVSRMLAPQILNLFLCIGGVVVFLGLAGALSRQFSESRHTRILGKVHSATPLTAYAVVSQENIDINDGEFELLLPDLNDAEKGYKILLAAGDRIVRTANARPKGEGITLRLNFGSVPDRSTTDQTIVAGGNEKTQ